MSVYDKIENGYYKELERSFNYSEFKTDLEKEFGIENNLKKDALFNLAWEFGHSYGLHEVYSYYIQLVELIK